MSVDVAFESGEEIARKLARYDKLFKNRYTDADAGYKRCVANADKSAIFHRDRLLCNIFLLQPCVSVVREPQFLSFLSFHFLCYLFSFTIPPLYLLFVSLSLPLSPPPLSLSLSLSLSFLLFPPLPPSLSLSVRVRQVPVIDPWPPRGVFSHRGRFNKRDDWDGGGGGRR